MVCPASERVPGPAGACLARAARFPGHLTWSASPGSPGLRPPPGAPQSARC